MGILTSLFTAVTGLKAYGDEIGTIGNNLSNVGTVGFKSSRMSFAELMSSQLGGSSEIGRGVEVAANTRKFAQGSLSTTGNALDLAIDGDGFFVVKDASGAGPYYTRAGQFMLNQNGKVADANGFTLQGYQANSSGVLSAAVTDIVLSTTTSSPTASSKAGMVANLNAAATVPAGAFSASDPTTYNYSTSQSFYDSLGAAHTLTFYFVKSAANTWAVNHSVDGGATTADTNLVFTNAGALSTGGTQTLSLTVAGGAATPQSVTMDFTGMTQYGAANSVTSQTQNGFGAGTLQSFSVDSTGLITGRFSNGQNRSLAQVILARFVNPQGLSSAGKNMYTPSTTSGQAVTGVANSGGIGRLQSGSLELSNVDLGEEFVNLISAQRGFDANSKVVTTSDQMLQTLVALKQ